jgi:hypothetical protein
MLINRFGNPITAPVVYLKALGSGKAELHIETNYYVELGHDHPAIYYTPSREAKGRYKVEAKDFTERQTYIYRGVFERKMWRGQLCQGEVGSPGLLT